MLRAVIFDFDGVISDSEILHFRSFNEVLAPYDIGFTIKEYYRKYLGFTDADCFAALVNEGRLKLDTPGIAELVRQKNRIFEKLAKSDGRIIEGVRDFLRMLKQNDIPMAICSGALIAEIELILEEAGLRRFFQVIISADQVKKGKPDPEGFLLTLQKLNETSQTLIAPQQCVVVEDSHWGLQAAKAAGMHTVAVTNSYDADQLATAERIVTQLGQLSITDLKKLCR